MKRDWTFGLGLLAFAAVAAASTPPHVVETNHVFDVDGQYGGWPANHGAWIWGNEILVGFSIGTYKDLGPNVHNIDRQKPEEYALARSLDGGHSWTVEHPADRHMLVGPASKGWRMGVLPPGEHEPEPVDCPGGIDFTDPNFALTLRMVDTSVGQSRFYYSSDRGRAWQGPFKLPLLGQKAISARTDYIVNGPHDCFIFVTAAKANGREGRIVCGRTTDGGRTFQFVSTIGPEPSGYSIMPSTVRLSATELLCTIRRLDGKRSWIEAWRSTDNCQSWQFANELVDAGLGNPPALLKLKDGRLAMIYGLRAPPYEIRAILSGDNGRTWSPPHVIEGNGGGQDIGYPRAVLRPDGKVVALYYFFTPTNHDRKINATIWDPGTL